MSYHIRLRQYFDSKGLSQREVAGIMGYSEVMMSKYLNTNKPNMEFIDRLITKFPDVDLNRLFKPDEIFNLWVNEPSVYGKTTEIVEDIQSKLLELKSILTRG